MENGLGRGLLYWCPADWVVGKQILDDLFHWVCSAVSLESKHGQRSRVLQTVHTHHGHTSHDGHTSLGVPMCRLMALHDSLA